MLNAGHLEVVTWNLFQHSSCLSVTNDVYSSEFYLLPALRGTDNDVGELLVGRLDTMVLTELTCDVLNLVTVCLNCLTDFVMKNRLYWPVGKFVSQGPYSRVFSNQLSVSIILWMIARLLKSTSVYGFPFYCHAMLCRTAYAVMLYLAVCRIREFSQNE